MDNDVKIRIVELSEAIKYMTKKLDQQEMEIKTLHRENAKQSEEIKDSMYLSETVRGRLDLFMHNCAEHKMLLTTKDKDVREVLKDQQSLINSFKEEINKVSTGKFVQVVQGVAATLLTLIVIIGAILGWIKVG